MGMTTSQITRQTIADEMSAHATELLKIASARAGEVTINGDAISTARIAANLCIGELPRGARHLLHTALADARAQVLRADMDYAEEVRAQQELGAAMAVDYEAGIAEQRAAQHKAEAASAAALWDEFRVIFN